MIWRHLRALLCRLGVDGACSQDEWELAEREARMQTLTWQLESLARERLPERKHQDGGRR